MVVEAEDRGGSQGARAQAMAEVVAAFASSPALSGTLGSPGTPSSSQPSTPRASAKATAQAKKQAFLRELRLLRAETSAKHDKSKSVLNSLI